MPTPLYSALTTLSARTPLRLHMPGHKGKDGSPFPFSLDFTEIAPTDNLYTPSGPIRQAEQLCAAAMHAGDVLFLTCGATQGIMTMLASAVGMGGTLILERGCHKSVYHAMALLDITPHYICTENLPGETISAPVTPAQLSSALTACPEAKAVLLTSPNYYGVITDLAPLADLCHATGVSLLVDQAHGAHFPFVDLPTATEQGADLAVTSTHKTWPAMGSSALLCIRDPARFSVSELKRTAAIFGTTSPSYPIMASIDWAREELAGAAGDRYRHTAARTAELRRWINENTPFRALSPSASLSLDPCRLTIDTLTAGLPGHVADELLQQQDIYVEMSDHRYLVAILTCNDTEADLKRLQSALLRLSGSALPAPFEDMGAAPAPVIRTSLRSALFGSQENLPLSAAEGRISAGFAAPYPPGIPVIAPGEEITKKHIAYLQKKSYNIESEIAVSMKTKD